MMTGTVNGERQPVLSLRVRDSAGAYHAFDAVIDTGFNGYLTLPSDLIAALALASAGQQQILLADGSLETFAVYNGLVEWDSRDILVDIDASDTVPLIGMALLDGYKMTLDAVIGGSAIIRRIRKRSRRNAVQGFL